MRGRPLAIFALLALSSPFLASCGSGGGGGSVAENRSTRGYNPGVGPFDSHGNYVERWANDQSKGVWWRKSTTSGTIASSSTPPLIASHTTPTPRPALRPSGPRSYPPVGGSTTLTPQPRAQATPRPQPRPTVKIKPKRKPPVRHTVKQGDTLWGISRKYKTSVTAIQRANGLKGTNLKIGRRLLIPRY
ncbi:MAG: LysM peptidoglycan-binding domain-containing protein [Verrucomicrobiae bacterium]|nr:LysM peptidoglycan-binding domain-containing protein [Verrucomicrobiae bacterium]NNJ44272.1 LysM peptidoglycan-binding domain-containing protein [Akkermansiaceae bacterium]